MWHILKIKHKLHEYMYTYIIELYPLTSEQVVSH
jgi:hypothetical protein